MRNEDPDQEPQSSTDPDADAIRRVLDGDVAAYAEVVERNEASLRSLVAGILADRHLVEDVVQEVFVIAYRCLGSFRGEARFSTWLTRIAIREGTRMRTRFRKVWRAWAPLDDADPATGGDRADRRAESQDEVMAILARLPTKERTPFVLHVLEGRSYEEIGEMLQCPAGTVGSHISRAKSRLRTLLLAAAKERNETRDQISAAGVGTVIAGRLTGDALTADAGASKTGGS